MGAITLDKVIFISMILESLVYGSRPKSSCSVTDKHGSGIFAVMFGFTLWVLIHERSGRINMRLLLPTLALYTLATAVSHLIEFMHRIIHLLLQAFDHRRISMCEGIHHTPRYTGPYCLSQRLVESKQPPQKFALCSTNSVGWLLFGKKNMTVTRSAVHDINSQIYRCSVVWQHNIWIIILPILLWISCAGK